MAGKTVLVLGGGTGGLVAANRLRRMAAREHRIILADRSPLYSFAPSYSWVMTGDRKAREICRDLRSLHKRGIEYIPAEIRNIDPANKRALLNEVEVEYDYLVISLGAEYSSEEIPGLHRAWTFYHLDGAEGLHEQLQEFTGGRIAVLVSSLPYKCPPAPYEGALLLDDYFRREKLRADVEIILYTPESTPLPASRRDAGEQVLDLLERRGIAFRGGVQVKSVNQTKRVINFEDDEKAEFDLLVATPVHKLPSALNGAGFDLHEGWLAVDRETLATNFEDAYAIGDVTGIPLANGHSLPKAGVFAHGQAEVVARNIAAELKGHDPVWAFGGHGACFMATQRGKAAYLTGHFYAEPEPDVAFRKPGRLWHWSKRGFERMWLWRWF